MGCEASKEPPQSVVIEQQIREDKKKAKFEVKLLLLGSGESGKTTVLKQMKLIHDVGFNQSERENFREIIRANLKFSMTNILLAMERLEISLSSGLEPEKNAILIEEPIVDYAAIKTLLKDPGVQEAISRSNEFQLPDSARPFFAAIDRIAADDFMPTDMDILHCRVKSTGITETKFKIGDLIYNMVDVGGQRSERRKWIHCFDNVTAIIFVVAVSAFDQVLIEDESVNRLHEALTLFESICNGKWFAKTSIIIFLNKIDLLQEKLAQGKRLVDYFPDFEGENELQSVVDFFSDKFREINQSDTKQLYFHQTCATDTEQIRFVMLAVNDIIIQKNLRNVGLL